MVFPLIPVAAAAAVVLGVGALVWYSKLTPEQKRSADQRANELALEWFDKALDKLDKVSLTRVLVAVRREISEGKSVVTLHTGMPRHVPSRRVEITLKPHPKEGWRFVTLSLYDGDAPIVFELDGEPMTLEGAKCRAEELAISKGIEDVILDGT